MLDELGANERSTGTGGIAATLADSEANFAQQRDFDFVIERTYGEVVKDSKKAEGNLPRSKRERGGQGRDMGRNNVYHARNNW